MCTVTYVPVKNGVHLTSNRDEWHTRSSALAPCRYKANDKELLYPKDKDHGGTWIVASNDGHAAVLLNGAFQPHNRNRTYRKSRGQVLLEIMNAYSLFEYWQAIDLTNIEPFTLILYSGDRLYECRWDGDKKHQLQLNEKTSHIWSSVTLYDSKAATKRTEWFNRWKTDVIKPGIDEILQFHKSAGADDPQNALLMTRDNGIATVSITSIHLSSGQATMIHQDLRGNLKYTSSLSLAVVKPATTRPYDNPWRHKIKRWWIRIRYWEYWPFDLLYIPVYVYWIWLSLKARSFFFFSAANPLIKNAGFVLESKNEIYNMIPQGYYPATIFCKTGTSLRQLKVLLQNKNLDYPLIAKPDIGQRGMQVKVLHTEHDLRDYAAESHVDFLIQEFISYKNEAGVFYYRMPGENKGKISGIVGKEFLTVTGDGVSTIEQLLEKEKRSLLQLPVLSASYGKSLQQVLPLGQCRELVPYGNHSRGAKFLDWSYLTTPELTETIDLVCRSIPEFYYGRLDIKFNSWEDLSKGTNFSIIELNGAGSEPTHMYDPQHSVFFAWREIMRHLDILHRISLSNARRQKIKLMNTREGMRMLRENRRYLKKLK